jgi:hypothetical protein
LIEYFFLGILLLHGGDFITLAWRLILSSGKVDKYHFPFGTFSRIMGCIVRSLGKEIIMESTTPVVAISKSGDFDSPERKT